MLLVARSDEEQSDVSCLDHTSVRIRLFIGRFALVKCQYFDCATN
jgi:hypothetical protein